MSTESGIAELYGKTLHKISITRDEEGEEDEIRFYTDEGEEFIMSHRQDCCEEVTIDDICGELSNLIGSPVLIAREDTNSLGEPKTADDEDATSFTWTFYNLATIKGCVTIKWYGSSNGNYSERVFFRKLRQAIETDKSTLSRRLC